MSFRIRSGRNECAPMRFAVVPEEAAIMQISEIMTPDPELIDPNASIREAAKRMRSENVGALPVGENDRLIGMVTDRDIAVRAVAEDRPAGTTSVRDVMSEKIFY